MGFNGYNIGSPAYNQFAQMGDMYRQQPFSPAQQSFAPQTQINIMGKIIQAENDIMPGDIPMNGTPCFFPMNDGSAIFMKRWNADGTISTEKFIPDSSAHKEPTQLDRIEGMLKRFCETQTIPPVTMEADNA